MTGMDFPSSPVNGQTTTDGRYYFDSSVGSTGAWRSTPLPVGGLPAGSIMAWGTNTPPANWLLADGSAVSRSVYSSLFAVIGTQYGTGDGTTTFNLPDLRGRVPVGRNGGTFGTLGATGGAETHTLTSGEMPSHTHTGTTSTTGAHSHQVYGKTYVNTLSWNELVSGRGSVSGSSATSTDGNHNHTFTTDASGGGQAHNNLQPYQVVNYIIKASAGWTAGDSELATRLGAVEAKQILSDNYIINGGFDIWQRGTSATLGSAGLTGYYTADRWATYNATGTGALARDTTNVPAGIQYGLRFTASAANSSCNFYHTIETLNSIPLAGKTVTVSLWLSGTAGTSVQVALNSSTTTDAAWTSTFTTVAGPSFTVTTTPTRYSFSTTVPANAKTLQVFVGSFSIASSSYVSFTGVQLEEGSIPTAFRRNAPSIQAELAACQRYFYAERGTQAVIRSGGYGNGYGSAVSYPVSMRVAPTVTVYSQQDWAGTSGKVSGYSSGTATLRGMAIFWPSTKDINFYIDSNVSEFIQFSYKADAEL